MLQGNDFKKSMEDFYDDKLTIRTILQIILKITSFIINIILIYINPFILGNIPKIFTKKE